MFLKDDMHDTIWWAFMYDMLYEWACYSKLSHTFDNIIKINNN